MKKLIKKLFKKPHLWFLNYVEDRKFNPMFSGIFINPFYFARKGLRDNIKLFTPRISGKILDVGCGTKPYKNIFLYEKYDGLEIDTSRTRANGQAEYYYDGQVFPFENDSYDAVLCNQVLEHIFEPSIFLKEINRVLKKGGLLLLTVPFVWDEHEQPYDYTRYTSFGISDILRWHDFKILEQRKSVNGIKAVFQLANGYVYKKTHSKSMYINILITIILMSPINMLGLFLSYILPTSVDLYLDNVILAQKN